MGTAKCSVCGRMYSQSGLLGDSDKGIQFMASLVKKPICPDCKRAGAFVAAETEILLKKVRQMRGLQRHKQKLSKNRLMQQKRHRKGRQMQSLPLQWQN